MPLNKARNNMYNWVGFTWNPLKGKCKFDCCYCLGENTLILMANSSWKKIKDIKIHDKIIGFTEISVKEKKRKVYIETDVTGILSRETEAIELVTRNKRGCEEVTICSPDHLWLSTDHRVWKKTVLMNLNSKINSINTQPQAPLLLGNDYKKGYLAGIIEGDAHFKVYRYDYDAGPQYHFRLVMNDGEAIERTFEYLNCFGIKTNKFIFDNKGRDMPAIRTSSKSNWYSIEKLIKTSDSKEWLRGYLSGIYDAEGSLSKHYYGRTISISNSDPKIIRKIEKGLSMHSFMYVKKNYNENVPLIRLLGGRGELIRFISLINPAIERKRKVLLDGRPKGFSEILSIKCVGKQKLYDIETVSGNFIANGLFSHNCYMKSIVRKPKPIRLVESELKTDLGENNVIFVGSSADMFHPDIPCEWIEEVLRHCNEFPDNKYLLQTKNPQRYWLFTHLIAKKNYALCTTIETNRDTSDISLAPPTCRRATQMAALSDVGYNISITIEPVLEFDVDIMVRWMKDIAPKWISIGADSKGHDLLEPSWDKVEQLILELRKFTKVVIKNNLGRLQK